MQPMKIMTMIWPTSMARHRSARQLRRKKRITAIVMRTRKRIIATAMRTRKSLIVTDTEEKSLIITMIMSITTTTDAIWQRS